MKIRVYFLKIFLSTNMKKIFPFICYVLLSLSSQAQFASATVDTLTQNNLREEVNNHSFAIDNSGTLHVIYQRENSVQGWDIYYKSRDVNGNWTAEVMINDQPGFHPSLSVNKWTGLPAVVYESSDSIGQIMLTSYDTAWSTMQLTNSTTSNYSPDIRIDSLGFYHVAYIGEDTAAPTQTYRIFYATNLSGSWSTSVLSGSQLGSFGTGAAPAIAVENDGTAHISFRGGNFNSYRIYHAFNLSPGSVVWGYDQIQTPNAEDLISTIEIGNDTAVHLAVSGNDGFGFPSKTFYTKKDFGASSFDSVIAVAPGFSSNVGDLFMDRKTIPHIVMDEISGNIYTGNVIYADSTDWNGRLILQTNEIYNSNLVMDSIGNGYVLAIQGNTFQTQEAIVFGNQPLLNGIQNNFEKETALLTPIFSSGELQLIFFSDYNGPIQIVSMDGKLIFAANYRVSKNEVHALKLQSLSRGIYMVKTSGYKTERFIVD
jgi:hypothetical protein